MFKKYLTRFANVVVLTVLLQAVMFAALIYEAGRIYLPAGIALITLSFICAVFVATGETHPVYRLAWVLTIMFVPVLGGVIYVVYNSRRVSRLIDREFHKRFQAALKHKSREQELVNGDRASRYTAQYLKEAVGFTPSALSDCAYFPLGENKLSLMLEELRKAERYIFLEYFIIEEGAVWDAVYAILEQKAREGVDVRLIYDGAGCLYPLPFGFKKQMEKAGIKIRVFNPVKPFVSPRVNVRNHRKIAVIDGKRAFCGGLNLADQYVNLKEMYGHWKDSASMVDGGAAWDMTLMFLSMWDFLSRDEQEQIDYDAFKPEARVGSGVAANPEAGLAVPMFDIPHDKVTVSEHVFLSLISRAEKYVYITTPYLMCGSEILSALYVAAKSGVDVRIITPYVADKRIVNAVTKSYYRGLLENKIRIFEYAPGFIHAKNIIADGKRAMVGTANLDYISLYMHHECGVCFFGGKVVADLESDFTKTFGLCNEVTLLDLERVHPLMRAAQRACRILAPFL